MLRFLALIMLAQSAQAAGVINQSSTATNPIACRLTDGTSFYSLSGGGGGGGGDASAANQISANTKLDTLNASLTTSQPRACTQSGAWSLGVNNFPATQAVSSTTLATESTLSGIKTGTDKIPSSPAAEHTTAASPSSMRLSDGAAFYKATTPADTQPVSIAGTVAVTGAYQTTQPVSIAGTVAVTGAYQATQPISGAVSVSNFPATQAVSGSVGITGTSNVAVTSTVLATGAAQDRTTAATPFACRASDGSAFFDPRLVTVQNAALAVTKSGTWALDASSNLIGKVDIDQTTPGTTNKVSIGTDGSVTLAAMAAASSSPTSVVSLGNSLGKTNVMKVGSLASSAVTADQVILTYTVTTGKTFYLTYFACNGRLTTFAATATLFGTCSIESPAGTKLLTTMLAGSGIGDRDWLSFSEPIPIAAGVVIRVVTTPAATTAMTWQANFGGYEK